MRRFTMVLGMAAIFTGSAVLPASAAPPTRTVDPVGAQEEADLDRLLTRACGVSVEVEGSGRVTTTEFTDRNDVLVKVQAVYATRFVVTNAETGASYTLLDVGPDRLLFENGQPVELQQIGRSLTGSGVIGRTVIDLTGQGPPQSTGRVFGDYVAITCEAIT